jgi:signal peptidase I
MEVTFWQRHPFLKDVFNIGLFVVCVVVGTLSINAFVFRSFNVIGPSMEPTMYTNDRLIVNRLPVTWSNLQNRSYIPERGQIIVFKNPRYNIGSADEYIVKRTIAFAGERVVLKKGQYTIYNSERPDGFNPDESSSYKISSVTSGEVDMIVPKDEVFVSGDHRADNYSLDSRNGLGTIPYYDIVGPVSLRFYPFDKIRDF